MGLGGSKRMVNNGHVSIQGEALGTFRVHIKKIEYPPTLSTYWLDLEGVHGIEKFKKTFINRKLHHPW